jgi:prevent-host-death family protein
MYSVYEAKARLSELLRGVRERGESFFITYHGEPVAEVRPIDVDAGGGLDARIERLRATGVLRVAERRGSLGPVAKRAGALKRFLEERSD